MRVPFCHPHYPVMKTLFLVLVLPLVIGSAHAADFFPGLKSVLTEAEWKRAGLDRLTPDEIGVINAALIRHQAAITAPLQTELAAARELATTEKNRRGLLERFGLTDPGPDWQTLPSLQARVLKWESKNRFQLDNGQVWEGHEPIVQELVGKNIEIQPRPRGQFALVVEGSNTMARVRRVR